jgi:predicted AAA+ superfamily ATPase
MFQRLIADQLYSAVTSFPVTLLTGPRQSGKTTLLKELFPDYSYFNLESPDTLMHAKQDPRGFLEINSKNMIIDEAQNFPELFSYLQAIVDQSQQKKHYILSGSQNFLLAEQISQTLAGRAAILELLPLCYAEYKTGFPNVSSLTVWEFLYYGGYPRPYHEKLSLKLWYESYIRTYIERDVRNLINIKDLAKFQLFLRLCAGRHGQLLNMNSLANDAGISHTTVSQWLSILEASYIIFRLQPYYKNYNKRLVKTPKLYFFDSGIVCQLLGVDSPEHLQFHSSRGAIFEGFALTEIYKHALAQARQPHLYYWRDHVGLEIDGLWEKGEDLKSIEIKASTTVLDEFFQNIYRWQKIADQPGKNAFLIYAGDLKTQRKEVTVLPWSEIIEFPIL